MPDTFMEDKLLLNSSDCLTTPEQQEILNLLYCYTRERKARKEDIKRYETKLKKLTNIKVIDLLKNEIGYSRLEKSVNKTREDFEKFGINTNNYLFLGCALYDVVTSLFLRRY